MKQLVVNLRSLWQVNFLYSPFYFFLTLAFESVVLYGNNALYLVALSATKLYSVFQKTLLFFKKPVSKSKHWKCSKSPTKTDGHFKKPQPSTAFRETYGLSVGFKIRPLRRSVFLFKTKANWHFAIIFVKRSVRSNHRFPVYLMNHLL